MRWPILTAALLLMGCATPGPQPGGYEDILAIAATYPAGELPIAWINQQFGREPDAPLEVRIGHRTTSTKTESLDQSMHDTGRGNSHRCRLRFHETRAQFNEFMECLARIQDAIFEVVVSELVYDEITLHTISGFNVYERWYERRGGPPG